MGPGARALGLEPGQVVEREPYDLLFGERKAPDGAPLGRPPGSGRKAAGIYAGLLAAEPHATGERKRVLRLEAARQARQSPLFFDLSLSLSKSVSIFHASLGENARLAREAGDAAGEEYWAGLVAEVDAMIFQAVRGSGISSGRPAIPGPVPMAGGWAAGRPASGMRLTWRWRTGCSTLPGTATCSCTSTPRSPTPPEPRPTGSGGHRTRSATTAVKQAARIQRTRVCLCPRRQGCLAQSYCPGTSARPLGQALLHRPVVILGGGWLVLG